MEGTAVAFSAEWQAPSCWAVKAPKPKGSCYLAGSETSGRAGPASERPTLAAASPFFSWICTKDL